MTWKKIVSLIAQGEGPSLEFKKRLKDSHDLAKELCAFSNGTGGNIVLGLDDKNGHLTGETASKEWITAIAKSKCTPSILPRVTTIEKAGKNILLITVLEGNQKPYYTDNVCYIREGKVTKEADIEFTNSIVNTSKQQPEKINQRQQDALIYVNKEGNITNKKYRELFNVSHKTAHIELTDLVRIDKLSVQGKGRSTCYINHESSIINNTYSEESATLYME